MTSGIVKTFGMIGIIYREMDNPQAYCLTLD